MSRRARRRLLVSVLIVGVGIAAIPLVGLLGGGADGAAAGDEAPPVIGRFSRGATPALEQAGFTGCPLVYVLAGPADADYDAICKVLADPAVTALMSRFAGALIDPADKTDAKVEEETREAGFRLVVRSLAGKFLGGLRGSFGVKDLTRLLDGVQREHPRAVRRSPLYTLLRSKPEAIEKVLEQDGREKAEWFVDLMAQSEPEGEASEPVAALRSRLAR